MTKPREPSDLERPRRYLGSIIRDFFVCPLCHRGDVLKVIAYRRRTTRICCTNCGLRFSIDPWATADRMIENAEAIGGGDFVAQLGYIVGHSQKQAVARQRSRTV